MARTDVISQWHGAVQFALSTTSPRSLTLTRRTPDVTALQGDMAAPWDYLEVDNRGNKGATIYWTYNGSTATATLQSTFTSADGAIATLGAADKNANFRLPPDSIDRVFGHFYSISVLAQGNATTVYINVGKY